MKTRMLILGIAAAALMGVRVQAQSSVPDPPPTCTQCGTAAAVEVCPTCVARPCDLFKGLKSLAACRSCAMPTCGTCGAEIADQAVQISDSKCPACAAAGVSVPACAPAPDAKCAACVPAIPSCSACVAPIPEPACASCGDAGCAACEQTACARPCFGFGPAKVLGNSVCGVQSIVAGLFGAVAKSVTPPCIPCSACTACEPCGIPNCPTCGGIAEPAPVCPTCGAVTVNPKPACVACAAAAVAADDVPSAPPTVSVAPTPSSLPESPDFNE